MKIKVLAITLKKDLSEGEMIYKPDDETCLVTKDVATVKRAFMALRRYEFPSLGHTELWSTI